jgi:hypothetical protein
VTGHHGGFGAAGNVGFGGLLWCWSDSLT